MTFHDISPRLVNINVPKTHPSPMLPLCDSRSERLLTVRERLRSYHMPLTNFAGDVPRLCDSRSELLLAWSRGVLDGHLDIAVVLEPGSCALQLGCDTEDDARTVAESSWSTFFLPMPHLCVFDSQQVMQTLLCCFGDANTIFWDCVCLLYTSPSPRD